MVDAQRLAVPRGQVDQDDDKDAAARRNRLTRSVFEAWLRKFSISSQTDSHGMMTVRVPRNSQGSTVTWNVAFDRRVAEERHAELITFTNPRFQNIIREIGTQPILSVRQVRHIATSADESEAAADERLIRADFSFHVTYSTYGDAREELITVRVGPEHFEDAVVTDRFSPEGLALPDDLGEYLAEAENRLRDQLLRRTKEFCHLAQKRKAADTKMLENHGNERATNKQDAADHKFYQSAIKRHMDALGEKYAVEVRVRLLVVEPYLGPLT